jgi:hypothetical protein
VSALALTRVVCWSGICTLIIALATLPTVQDHQVVPHSCVSNNAPCFEFEKNVPCSVHHKKHISKVMAHANVGYYFDGTPENGGEGVLLHLQRCQAFKVAQRGYKGKGGRAVKKGDCILTDCNVTGTDTGTPDKPKFALRPLWEYCLIPS